MVLIVMTIVSTSGNAIVDVNGLIAETGEMRTVMDRCLAAMARTDPTAAHRPSGTVSPA